MSEASASAENERIAGQFEEVAELLDAQQANRFRVQAYLDAASTLRSLDRDVSAILDEEGVEGLEALPHIGRGLAAAIEGIVHAEHFGLLNRLRGESSPERLLTTVPGVGPKLAARLHEELGIDSLAELERAAHDGRLENVQGFGEKRVRGIRDALAGRFRRQHAMVRKRTPTTISAEQPPVAEVLSVDEEYRNKARTRVLPRIAPRRFNPTHESWLPILHTTRDDRHYTALYSNTARAHEMGKTHDWVVIYRDDAGSSGQWTVVTARYGQLEGRRIVRGREVECRMHYGLSS